MKRLHDVLDEHTSTERDGATTVRVFTASGNRYIDRSLHAIDDHHRMFVPIIDGIVRDDLRIVAAPSDAIARLLQREGIIE